MGIVGARPNFMKIDPVFRQMEHWPDTFSTLLVHTGQHYDDHMSQVFFRDLGLRRPDIDLGVGSGTHAEQTGRIMIALEKVLVEHRPDLVVVVGDVNSTLAGAVVAAKLWIPVAHVEAGLRSFDRQMPEEINRIVTDVLSSYLFTPSRDANRKLVQEGIPAERIYFVGNVMIDTLQRCLPMAQVSPIFEKLKVARGEYGLLTLHRPANVDVPEALCEILEAVEIIQSQLPVVFPIHPRTRKRISEFGLKHRLQQMLQLLVTEPLGYLDFLALEASARLVLTDSGGIQEETTVLDVPCLTLRETTERPITVEQGTNTVVGHHKERIVDAAFVALQGNSKKGRTPELWDGQAATRIADILAGWATGDAVS